MGWVFADRVDLPFITEPNVADQRLGVASFGARNWAAEWLVLLALSEFAASGWQSKITVAPPPNAATTNDEIDKMVTAALNERPDALGEIFAQADEFMSYFMTALGAQPRSHPATFMVLNIANAAATMAVMHFKMQYNRARPSQLCPALLPPLQVPGHASYPSGHATQAHAFALCAQRMLPTTRQGPMGIVLQALAGRVARNREIAGLHYESDSAAGATLAADVVRLLTDPTNGQTRFADAMTRATAEWS